MLVSSLDPEAKEILQTCYGRGQIRQLFDISDIDGELSPPAVQGEDVLRGHLMICFMASVLRKIIAGRLEGSNRKLTAEGALSALHNVKCKVFDDEIVAQKFTGRSAEVLKLCGIAFPPEKMERSLA